MHFLRNNPTQASTTQYPPQSYNLCNLHSRPQHKTKISVHNHILTTPTNCGLSLLLKRSNYHHTLNTMPPTRADRLRRHRELKRVRRAVLNPEDRTHGQIIDSERRRGARTNPEVTVVGNIIS
jgi:hypothetical protein